MRQYRYIDLIDLFDTMMEEAEIKEVIFNNPATIIKWTDGTKTIAKKSKEDEWDKEKGLMVAYLKKKIGKKNLKKLMEKADC